MCPQHKSNKPYQQKNKNLFSHFVLILKLHKKEMVLTNGTQIFLETKYLNIPNADFPIGKFINCQNNSETNYVSLFSNVIFN